MRSGYFKGYNMEYVWIYKLCLWDLFYFKDFFCLYNIDVMYTEKNIAKVIFGILFDTEGKLKDNFKVRIDLEVLCDRSL